jgi:DNA-binding transcriptional LysR family regulator
MSVGGSAPVTGVPRETKSCSIPAGLIVERRRERSERTTFTRSLRRGDLDLGVSFDYPEIGDTFGDDLHLEHLLDDPFDVVVPRGHRLERARRFASRPGRGELAAGRLRR